jgi:hypothetical protein
VKNRRKDAFCLFFAEKAMQADARSWQGAAGSSALSGLYLYLKKYRPYHFEKL